MPRKNLNQLVSVYKSQLDKGDIQVAYTELVKFVMGLKTRFSRTLGDQYNFGSIFQGYMDYTYFYFWNDRYKDRKLKLGLVLNHAKMRFEIWLLGQTKDVQEEYWIQLRRTEWIQDEKIPKYSIFAHTLVNNPNFDKMDSLIEEIESKTSHTSDRILQTILKIENNT